MIDDMMKSMQDLIKMSKDMYLKSRGPKSQNYRICLILYDEGWRSDKIEYIENSTDIMVYWTKNNQTQSVRLTLEDQSAWIKELDRRVKDGK